MNMRKKYLMLPLLAAIISSCTPDNPENKYDVILQQYEGEYELESMEWIPEGGKTMVVDINDDKQASNDLLEEILVLHDGVKLNHTKFNPDYGKRSGTFSVKIPILDYYQTEEVYSGNITSSHQCFLKANIGEDGSMTSGVFDHLEWADEDRIGVWTFGGVSMESATPERIVLNVDRYMVYDFRTSKKMIGKVLVTLTRYK